MLRKIPGGQNVRRNFRKNQKNSQAFLIQIFEEHKIISKHCKFPRPPSSSDITPAECWLWRYLKYRVYRYGLSNLSELKIAIRHEASCIQPNILHSAVARYVTRLQCVFPCGGGHWDTHISVIAPPIGCFLSYIFFCHMT